MSQGQSRRLWGTTGAQPWAVDSSKNRLEVQGPLSSTPAASGQASSKQAD